MKKTVTAVLCSLILLTGCGAQDNITKKAASIIPNDAVISPDGKLAVCQYVKEDLEDEKGLLYSIYDVQLYDNEKYIMICTFHIVGRDFHFIWSPNSKYVTAAYFGLSLIHICSFSTTYLTI